MTTTPVSSESLHHHIKRMSGRDPHEAHRVATPLELLFDLTFATAFGLASSQLAHSLAEGHYTAALLNFATITNANGAVLQTPQSAWAQFGCIQAGGSTPYNGGGCPGYRHGCNYFSSICWAWINFSWFSSAYDTDDWIFRLVTMVQMIGVLVLAIGLPRMFTSIENGEHLDNSIMVLGYVIMRVAMIFQWLRAARQDPSRREICLTYVTAISIAQVGWVVQILFDFSVLTSLVLGAILLVIELAGPVIAERRNGGTPWHAHHMAERYSLFAIIALGESVVGTLATLSAVVEEQGWNLDAVLVGVAGTGLTFGMWWVYYMLPSAPVLHAHRDRAFVWGYGQMLVVAAIVATGAGLHVAAYFIEHKTGYHSLRKWKLYDDTIRTWSRNC